ncbi:MAG: ATPase component NikO of energizing module of nickel ECF transporter [uncultured Acidimicrobiales bacterium]|uniref:ATPase component NikO of energizing module of nickel ECF transporter n=1 Tax=uncultured Acidimicrobiales bacterium TaxID=310071 RepID=A0A6J4JEL7_9ACTN|nr:MAG: ATPase component NikO of energizing module of nickel ECF transporter [uncultured Acidimicrobiales bacterium]
MTAPALLVVGHGSRDPRAGAELDRLVANVRALTPGTAVGVGSLELAEPHVDAAVDDLVGAGASDIVAVPVVLFGAGHLKDDGPAVLGRARRRHPGVRFRLARDLGIHPAVLAVAEDRARAALGAGPATGGGCRAAGADAAPAAVVLVGRGSTDPDACADLVKLARLLEDGRDLGPVQAAFAAMSQPDVEAALDRCRRLGSRRVAVVPLLLFSGVLVDRVGERARQWAADDDGVEVSVADHLGPDPRLAELVVERFREASSGDVRMNCDLCVYRVRLPGFEDKLGTPLSLAPLERSPRGWRARRAANQSAEQAAAQRERPRRGLGRRSGIPEAPDRSGPAVQVAALSHSFPDGTRALTGVSLVVERGQRVAILGPNGSGKTTLALHLIGALDRQAGGVTVTGLEVGRTTLAEVRRRVGFVFQDPDDQLLLPTVADDVALGPTNLGLPADEVTARVTTALDVVGLADLADRAPQHLSLGERRRAALAGVLAVHPELLVLDEPSANLDPRSRRDLVEIVAGLDVTAIVVTHDLSLALELCPRSVVLDRGVVAADGPTRLLLSNPGLMAAHGLDLPYGMVVPPL